LRETLKLNNSICIEACHSISQENEHAGVFENKKQSKIIKNNT
jgi:hypothetical protein